MDHRRVLLPLNLDFNPLSPCSSCSVSRNDVCCHSAPAIFPITNPEASTSASTLSMSSRDPNDSSDDGNDESGDNVVQIKQQSSNKSFTRATNEDKLPHDGQLKNLIKVGSRKLELHPPLDPKNKIGTSAELQSSINDLGTSPKFVLKRKSVKIVDQDSHNTTGNQSDATYVIRDKSHTTAKSQMSAISSCLSLSKVDINGNSMNCADNKTKTVPKQKKNSQRKKEEQIPPSNYIPPPLDLLERFHFLSSGNEARSSVSQNEDFQNISKEGDEGDPDSFQPPKLPKHIQEKLLETIQSMKKTSSPSQRKDHGQGEETGVQKNDDVEYDLDSKIHHISFHYETKNGCLEGLTATGFSVNPTDPDGQSYLPNPVSTYFPGKPASQRNMVNFGVTQIPSFMKHNFYRNGEGGEMKNDQLYQLVMDKAHKSRRTLSNLSMMPMMYSENGSHPRIHELERGMSARSENVTTLKICGNPEPNPMSSLRKPKMPNSTEVLEALELNNNYKLDIPLESKTSGFRFSTYYRDLSKRLKFSKAFQPYDKEKAILSHKNQTGVKKFSRPITRRASNLASPTPPTITNLANVPNQKPTDTKITKTTVSTVRKVNSTGSIPKSVSSHNLKVRSRSSHAFNLSTENQNSNGGNSPEIKTAPNLTHPLQTGSITIPGQNTALRALLHKKRTKVPSLKIPAKKKPPMPPTIKNAEISSTSRRVARKLNAQLEKSHHDEPEVEGASPGGEGLEKVVKLKTASKSKPLRTKKLKYPVVNDPYYLNSTESEKEIIKELVRADVDAMLERDAVALLTPDEDELLEELQVAPPPPPAQTKLPKKEVATHWSWRANDATKSAPTPGNKLFVGAGSSAGAKNKSRVAGKVGTTKEKPIPPSSMPKSKRK